MLAERSAIDELSAVGRQVLGVRGGVALEVRGGAGYDRARDVVQWRAGGSLLVAATAASRLTFAFDSASERATDLVGRRHTGMVTFHVNL